MPAVVQIDAWDIAAAAAVTLRAASDDDAGVCHQNGQTWWPMISKLPTLRYDLFSGQFDGTVDTPSSSLALSTEAWPGFAALSLADARFRLWTGKSGDLWSNWTLRFDGRVLSQPPIDGTIATLSIAVDDRWLDTPVLATYAGTTGAEGPAGLKGTPKPLALGAPRYQAGVLIDPTNTVIQLSAYGAIEDVTTALERLARFNAPVGDYTDYSALVAASIPAGAWATAKLVGMVRQGAPPTGKLSYLVKGDKAGPDGWVRKPGEIVRRIALLAGGAGKIDDSSIDAADAARPWNVSLVVEDQASARELAQRVAASVNAVAGVSWLGKLFVAPVGIGASAAVELHPDGSALPPVAELAQVETGGPFWRLDISAERAWTVQALDEIAFTAQLIDLGARTATTVYREGNIAQEQGISWVYTNPAPSAGNAPPALPATSNSWWRVWDARLAGIEDGATRNDDGANMIPAPVGLDQAIFSNGASLAFVVGASGRIADRYRAQLAFAASSTVRWSPALAIPCAPGETLYYRHAVKSDVSTPDSCNPSVSLYASDGAALGAINLSSQAACSGTEAIGTWVTKSAQFVVPAGTAYVQPYAERPVFTTGSFFVGEPYLGRQQPGADVSQGVVLPFTTVPVTADFDGTVKAGQLPLTIRPTVFVGGVDVSLASSYAVSFAGGTATVDNTPGSGTRGLVTLSAASASGPIQITVTPPGGAAFKTVSVSVVFTPDPPPPATTGSGGGASSASTTTFAAVSSGSYPATPTGAPVTVRSDASGRIQGIVSLNGYTQWRGKIVYRLASGGSWSDFAGGEVLGTAPGTVSGGYGWPTPGNLSINQTQTGLTASTDYQVATTERIAAGGTNTPSGSFTAKQP